MNRPAIAHAAGVVRRSARLSCVPMMTAMEMLTLMSSSVVPPSRVRHWPRPA